jgi:phosphate-selective porin OprO/OprP
VRVTVGNHLKYLCAAAGLGLLVGAGTVRAEDPNLEEMKTRLDRLEKQNEYLRKVIEAGGIQATSAGTAVGQNKAEIEKVIADYMKAQADAAKAAEAKHKAEIDAKGYDVGSDLSLKASWKNGLYFESPYKDFKFHVGGRVQNDWYWFNQDDQLKANPNAGVGNLRDGTFMRRIRLETDGTAWEILEWDLDVAFEASSFDSANVVGSPTGTVSALASGGVNGGSSLFFQDAWVGLTQLPIIGNVRMGHIKVPMGLESLTSSRFLTFLERADIFEVFFQEYDPGIVVFNNYCDERGTWAACFHRIDPQEDAIDFGDGDYAFTGRVTFLPVWEHNGRCLAHVGASYQYRNCDEPNNGNNPNTVRFRTRPEFRDNQDIVGNSNRWINTGNIPATDVQTVGLEGLVVWGPFSVQGEYVNAWVDRSNVNADTVSYHGYYLQASCFLTGEHRAYDRRLGRTARTVPYENFFAVMTGDDCCQHCCCAKGAWEIAARYSSIDLTDFATGSDGIGGKLDDWTIGLNWYLNPNFTVQWNYVHAHRHDLVNGALPGSADALGMRFRLDF